MPVIIWDLDSTIFDTHLQLIHADGTFDHVDDIQLYPDALTALTIKGVAHVMVSYAKHSVDIQNKKIDILGIRDFFDEIHIVSTDGTKIETMRDIKQCFKGPFYVVGDKINDEIRYGNQLGMTTILCPRGEHMKLAPQDDYEKPDYVIQDLTELKNIVKKNG